MSPSEHLALFLIALVANALSALAGGGAGLIQLPMLIFLGLPFGIALATHKVASVALGVGASIRHGRNATLEWPIVLLVVGAGVPGVVLGARCILDVPEQWAQQALGVLTLGLGLYSLARPQLGQHNRPNRRDQRGYLIAALMLFLFGFLNGSLTSGTGLFVTLCLVSWFGMDYQRAVAHTLILVGLFWNSSGALTLGLLGNIAWDWLPALLVGSLLGGYLGAHLAIANGNTLIKRLFEITTLLVGIKLLLG